MHVVIGQHDLITSDERLLGHCVRPGLLTLVVNVQYSGCRNLLQTTVAQLEDSHAQHVASSRLTCRYTYYYSSGHTKSTWLQVALHEVLVAWDFQASANHAKSWDNHYDNGQHANKHCKPLI